MTNSACPQDILRFWFDWVGAKRWFVADDDVDQACRVQFGVVVDDLVEQQHEADWFERWMESPEDALALIILLDQFPRNLYRGDARSFALDARALDKAESAVKLGYDQRVAEQERSFIYMPFMHSEDLAMQDRCVELFEAAGPSFANSLHHAKAHRELIRTFGRFPHRNASLGRESTAEERAFLSGGGYQPGARAK